MRVIHEVSKCIGCGTCSVVCPDYWEMGDDAFAHLKGAKINAEGNEELETDDKSCHQEAAESCPVQIIHIDAYA